VIEKINHRPWHVKVKLYRTKEQADKNVYLETRQKPECEEFSGRHLICSSA
jgi:hypothetical protein